MKVLNDLVIDLGNDLTDYIERQASEIVSQLHKEAKKQGIPKQYMPYLWWTFLESSSSSWVGDLPKTQSKLLVSFLSILARSGMAPDYNRDFEMPPVEYEPLMDKAIEGLGKWALRLRTLVYRKYQKLLDKRKKEAAKRLGVPTNDAKLSLAAWFAVMLERHMWEFQNGDLLYTFLGGLI